MLGETSELISEHLYSSESDSSFSTALALKVGSAEALLTLFSVGLFKASNLLMLKTGSRYDCAGSRWLFS